jgi:pyruvate dehydrogenase E1 component alpha subunit
VEEGAFWESLNFACLKKLRIYFVCEDNGLAIHTLSRDREGFRSIPEAVAGFRCRTVSLEGVDALKIFDTVRELDTAMDENPMPCFLHLNYFRFLEHVGIGEDFAAGYRLRPGDEELRRLDPVAVSETVARREGVTEEELNETREAIDRDLEAAVTRALEDSFPGTEDLWR